MNSIRFAVIGTGHLGRIHTRLLRQNTRADLVAVVDRVPQVAQNIAAEYGTAASNSHRDLFGKIDAAIVATPTAAHYHVASELIDVGVHVFVEKPITLLPSQARQLIQAAARQRVILQVGHVEQFNPAWVTASRLLKQARFIEARRCAPFSYRSTDISVVHDLMIHDIELLLSAIDSPIRHVAAWGQAVLTDHLDTVSAWVDFHDGRAAHLTASRVHSGTIREMHVHENERQLLIDFARSSVTELATRDPEPFSRTIDQNSMSQEKTSPTTILDHAVSPGNAIEQEHNDFIDSILENRQPRVSGERGHDALVLAERIVSGIDRQSNRTSLRPAA